MRVYGAVSGWGLLALPLKPLHCQLSGCKWDNAGPQDKELSSHSLHPGRNLPTANSRAGKAGAIDKPFSSSESSTDFPPRVPLL